MMVTTQEIEADKLLPLLDFIEKYLNRKAAFFVSKASEELDLLGDPNGMTLILDKNMSKEPIRDSDIAKLRKAKVLE